MDAEQLRNKDIAELKIELKKTRGALMKSRFAKASSQLKNPSEIPSSRRTIARILTILKEKGAGNE